MTPETFAVGANANPALQAGKLLELSVLKQGAQDFLSFVDDTKETFYAYLYHRIGSTKEAQALMNELYLEALSRAMSLFWFGTLSLKMLLSIADEAIAGMHSNEADLDQVYLPTLEWLSLQEVSSIGTLHDAVWTLPPNERQLVILSLLVGMPDERLAQALGIAQAELSAQLSKAREMLIAAWRPVGTLPDKLNSLVYVPSLDLNRETQLRLVVVEKYNALRLRRYQWVVIGGLLAVFSNLIVASVLAFAVVVEPPTNLRTTRTQVASLDAVLLERQQQNLRAKEALAASLKQAQGIVAYNAARDLTTTGLGVARETFNDQVALERDVDGIINLLRRAQTAMGPALQQIAAVLRDWLTI